jgi:lambda repressor-like predicted transcriptional regulator
MAVATMTPVKADVTGEKLPFKCSHYWKIPPAWEAVDGIVTQVCKLCGEEKDVLAYSEEEEEDVRRTYERHQELEARKPEILAELEKDGWNVHLAAKKLKISPSTLYSLVTKTWKIDWRAKRTLADQCMKAEDARCVLLDMLEAGLAKCLSLEQAKQYVQGLKLVHEFHGCQKLMSVNQQNDHVAPTGSGRLDSSTAK